MRGSDPIAAGTTFGRYQITSLLSAGGMGEVYHARDPELERDLVLKLLPRRAAFHPDALQRFIREARAASALNHPNIVTIYEIGEAPGGHFIAMELVQGRTLRELRKEATTIPRIANIGAQAVRALAVAHAAGIVHRDIKPENLMVRDDGYLKVLDFGIARLSQLHGSADEAIITRPGMIVGTMRYMSPEQGVGEAVESASDLFSLGLVLYELAAGRHPFESSSDMAVLSGIVTREAIPPSRFNARVPEIFDSLMIRMLAKDPAARPKADEVAEILDRMGSTQGSVSRIPAAAQGGVVVGREPEMQTLSEAFQAVAGGRGSMVCVSGEPGIGKTTLIEEFLRKMSASEPFSLVMGRCSERLAGAEAYLPLLDAIDEAMHADSSGKVRFALDSIAPTWSALIGSEKTRERDESTDPPVVSQERMKREIVAFLEEVASSRPLVLFIEDIHWADVSTVDVLGYVLTRLQRCRLLTISTYRPEELHVSQHPFLALKLDLQTRGIAHEILLGFLSQQDVKRFIDERFPGHRFPPAFPALIHSRTEGSPLFVEDLLRYLRTRGALVEQDGVWTMTGTLPDLQRDIPESMRSMVERKVGQLNANDRNLLAAAAIQGHSFDCEVIARAIKADPTELEDRLDALDRIHGFVRRRDEREFPNGVVSARYRFVHVLYQNALYASLSVSKRVAVSRAVGEALLELNMGAPGSAAAELGFLFETAREFERAGRFFAKAAESAVKVFAFEEAAVLARRALAIINRLPSTPDTRCGEMTLQLILSSSVAVTAGYAAAESLQAMARARALAEDLDAPSQLARVFWGMHAYYVVRGELLQALDISEQALRVATQTGEARALLAAHTDMGITLRFLGRLTEAREHLEKARDIYDPSQAREYFAWFHLDPGVFAHCERMRTLWYLGYPDQAAAARDEAVRIARARPDPRTLAFALLFAGVYAQLAQDPQGALAASTECLALCDEHGIAQERVWTMTNHGWAMARLGPPPEGIEELNASIAIRRQMHANLNLPYAYLQLADAYARHGQPGASRRALTSALEFSQQGMDSADDAEIYRMFGDLALMPETGGSTALVSSSGEYLLSPADADDLAIRRETAEGYYRRALEIARSQAAKSYELRTSTSLAK
ncbi:MAG TPA: protein kinase, partial [Gemmatimonadaceae bacterium]|nr:protein kinase [Gemmatimonadaceae bacterium]